MSGVWSQAVAHVHGSMTVSSSRETKLNRSVGNELPVCVVRGPVLQLEASSAVILRDATLDGR